MKLIVDDQRGRPGSVERNATGIFVRAKYGEEWGAFDIATLTRSSLIEWLRSRGGDNEWAENAVAMLLGHESSP